MVGSATLVIVRSTMVMKYATASTAKARQRRTSPGAAASLWLTDRLRRPPFAVRGQTPIASNGRTAATALTAAAPHTASSVARCPACPGWLSEMPTVLSSHLPPTAQ